MKTLTNLTATVADSAVATPVIAGKVVAAASPAVVPSGGIVNTQAQEGFWRRVRHAKGGSYYESSTGASVFVPLAETFKLIEANEPLFVAPTAAPKT
jgi:hypothetical protein